MEDIDILLKIKLLRSLKISIAEIKSIQKEEISLSESLSLKIKELKQEEEQTKKAIELCQVIKNDNPIFKDLDANKYLNYHIITNKTITYDNQVDREESLYPYYTLRRYLARMIDFGIYATIINVSLIWSLKINFVNIGPWFNYLISFLALVTMLVVEPFLLKVFGTTVGKFIFGLAIRNIDDEKSSYAQGYARTKEVLWEGLRFNIPIFR